MIFHLEISIRFFHSIIDFEYMMFLVLCHCWRMVGVWRKAEVGVGFRGRIGVGGDVQERCIFPTKMTND